MHALMVRTYVEEDARDLAPALPCEVDQLHHRHRCCCCLLRVFELLDYVQGYRVRMGRSCVFSVVYSTMP